MASIFWLTLCRGLWYASLNDSLQTYLIDLPTGPVWRPPSRPHAIAFASVFPDLPSNEGPPAIVVHLNFEGMLLNGVLQILMLSVAVA